MGLFRKRSADPARELRGLLGSYELPTFRTSVLTALRLLRDEKSTTEQIAREIELDPGMHVRILRTVNSAAFGLSTRVSSVPHALALLGRSRVEPLVLGLAVRESLPVPSVPNFDVAAFWHRSTIRALAARGFARRLHSSTQDQSYTAGLLLDLAVPVLAAVKGAPYVEVYRTGAGSPEGLAACERRGFGYDHTVAGRLIAEAWGLPEHLCQAIAFHHEGDTSNLEPAILLAAQILDEGGPDGSDEIASAAAAYGLGGDAVTQVLDSARLDAGRHLQDMG
jgi:HD-like signal output (HDOD) protein